MTTTSDAASPPPEAAPRPTFALDHMLIRLGRWLRLCGYDAEWDPTLDTRAIIRRANAEGRIFLTCNTHIPHNFPAPSAWLRLRTTTPIAQFHELVARLGLDPARQAFSRCVRCNEPLVPLAPSAETFASLPPRVRARRPPLWRCPACGRLYWRGTHVDRTGRMLGLRDV